MKKIIFAVISLTLFVSCRIFHTTEPTNSAHWYVKNMTWKPIVIKKRDFRTERLLNPGDSISVFHRLPMQKLGFPSFDLFYELWNVNGNGVEQNLDVLSENGQLLKTWKISDKKWSVSKNIPRNFMEILSKTTTPTCIYLWGCMGFWHSPRRYWVVHKCHEFVIN